MGGFARLLDGAEWRWGVSLDPKCPTCGKTLTLSPKAMFWDCHSCGFSIGRVEHYPPAERVEPRGYSDVEMEAIRRWIDRNREATDAR